MVLVGLCGGKLVWNGVGRVCDRGWDEENI
jgi:hypothetical protein